MKKLAFVLLFSTFNLYASDCFMNYQQVCGQDKSGSYRYYVNQCELTEQGATVAKQAQCDQDEAGRSPASFTGNDELTTLNNMEAEIAGFLGQES